MTPQETLTRHGIKLESYKAGRHYTVCPKCSHTRSREHQKNKVLGVTIGDDGSVCWGCNHCAWRGPEKGTGERQERRELTSYVYRDADGVVRFRKVRNAPGREPRFWLERADGRGGWVKGTKDVNTKILYRLDEVTQAIAAGRVIACVEGEKDADNLWSIGIAATCNAHGASEPGKRPKWTKAHSEQLAGADLVAFNDNDAAGYEHADVTCKLSIGVAKRARRLDLKPPWPEIPKGGDVSDWLALGHTREELEALITAAPDYAPVGAAAAAGTIDADAEIERLARLKMLDYERERTAASKRLGMRASVLDIAIKGKRADLGLGGPDDDKQGEAVSFPEVEPWPQPVNGAELLSDLATAIRKHVVMSDVERDVCALWTVHSYMIRRFMVSPKLWVRSVIRGCGKTTLLDVLSQLAFRAWVTGSITKSALFRVIAKWRPTLLIDEVDTFVGDDEELRGIINNSHRYDGTVTRTVGDDHEPRKFPVYAAVALSGIGGIAATLVDRSIIASLKRKLLKEKATQLRIGQMGHLHDLRRQITRWVADNEERIKADPAMPEGLINREADNWTPLLAIAEAAGGDEWPERARAAAKAEHLVHASDEGSRLEQLLADIRSVFRERTVDYIGSADLVTKLVKLEGRPWKESMGKNGDKPLTQKRLADMLNPLGITTQKVGPRDDHANGYKHERFEDAWERYLGPEGGIEPEIRTPCDEIRTSRTFEPDSTEPRSPVLKSQKSNIHGLESGSPVRKGGQSENGPIEEVDTPAEGLSPANRRQLIDLARATFLAGGEEPRSREELVAFLQERVRSAGIKAGSGVDAEVAAILAMLGPLHVCVKCKKLGPELNVTLADEDSVWLHRRCEDEWIETRMAEEGIWRA